MILLRYLFCVIFVLVGVAFFTLFERKILGYSHIRFGPNKVLFRGILQPITDAIKLFTKEDLKLKDLNINLYIFSPFFYIFIRVFIWAILSF